MHTTNQLLDALAAHLGGATDYRLGKVLNTSTASTVFHWRRRHSSLGPAYAVKLADALGWDRAYVLACIEHEKAARLDDTAEIAATWEKIAERFKPAAAVILIALACVLGVGFPEVSRAASASPSIHYAKYKRPAWRPRWLRFLTWLPNPVPA